VLSNLRLLKGQRLDSSNPTHAALLRRAADAGVIVDPDGWNDAASNQTLVEIVDPENPTQKRRALLNKATGELSDVGQSGYVQPVNTATGMTAAQAAADSDRDRSFGEARRMNDARLGQIGVQIERARRDLEGVSPAASREFQIATRGLNEQLNKKLAEVERWRKNVAEARVSPDAARERIERLEREIGEIQGRVESAREKALGRRGGGAPQRSSSPGGRFAGQRMSRSRLPEAARRMGVSEAEAERVIRAEGGEVY
jgi:type II secretory pathway component PulM